MTTPHPTPEERYEAALSSAVQKSLASKDDIMPSTKAAMITAIREAEAAGEARGRAMVQETWFSDRALPVMAMSGDVESDRVLKLHFRRTVNDNDRRDLTDALNLLIQHSRGQLYTRAQLEAHAAEQVRPLVEAAAGLIESVIRDSENGNGISDLTMSLLSDAAAAIRARGQV